jgi:orotidine-5'-phosphate decarboxylase
MRAFGDRLADAVDDVGVPACVGLDPHVRSLPSALRAAGDAAAARAFCLGAIEAVAGLVPAVKPQVAFFEALGSPGWAALEDVVAAAKSAGLLVILDGKRGDIGSTAEAYAHAALDDDGPLGADACTLAPYLGAESLAPFVARCDAGKGAFVLLRTSNPGSDAWQAGIADKIGRWVGEQRRGERGLGSIGAVVGATLPSEAREWRRKLPNTWFLVPGYGAQGAGAEDVRGQLRPDGMGALIVSARGVLFPAKGEDADWKAGIRARAQAFRDELRGIMP